MEIAVGKATCRKKTVRHKCQNGKTQEVFLPLPPVALFFPFPVQLPREPLLVSAYYVLGLGFITVNS